MRPQRPPQTACCGFGYQLLHDNHRAITTAAKIAAADTIRFDAALIAALAQLEAAQLQHDTAIEVARIQATATVEAARLAYGGHLPPAST